MPTSHSGTPLAKKLGLKEGVKVLLHNQPDHYFELFSDLPEEIDIIRFPKHEVAELVHIFCYNLGDLKRMSGPYKDALKKNGAMWVSWPKEESNIPTNLNRDIVREFMLDLGLVDVKIAAVNDEWSALKFMYRKEDR